MFSARTRWSLTPNELTKLCQARQGAGLSILDLTESNPTRCGFGYDTQKVLKAFRDPRVLSYEPDPRGLASAREAIVGYYQERGARLDPNQIFMTASTSEAYSLVFRLIADAGDRALGPQPSYPLFDFLTRLNDLELARYPLVEEDRWRIDRNTLESRISPRCRAILVVHPNNPTGSFVDCHDREFLLGCCARRQLALIADEVFYDYAHAIGGDERHQTFAGEKRALVFTLNGLSKISALPQMKCAWIVLSGPGELVREASARLEVIADTYLSMSTPVALALPDLLSVGRDLQPQIMARIRTNLACLDQRIGMDSPVSRLTVEGGWYAILRLPAWRSDEAWSIRLLDQDGVLVHPGHFYDFRSDGRVAMSLICHPEIFELGVEKLIARVERDTDLAARPAP
jgi:alanine-synthesizing transaminase